jgi:hypothetical protein
MENHNSYEYGRREFHRSSEENTAITIVLAITALIALVLYILVARYHFRIRQIVELSIYLVCFLTSLGSVVWYTLKRKKRIDDAWPHPPVFVPQLKDHTCVERAFDNDSIIPGYDNHGKPWYWSDESRRMQAVKAPCSITLQRRTLPE